MVMYAAKDKPELELESAVEAGFVAAFRKLGEVSRNASTSVASSTFCSVLMRHLPDSKRYNTTV